MKKLVLLLFTITLFSCSKEAETKVQPAQEISFSIEERNKNLLTLDSLVYDERFRRILFFDKGIRRTLGVFPTSPFLSYPNQSLLIDQSINVNIKKIAGREYLIFKNIK